MRLLLAEDEQDLSKALCAILKHNNYSVDPVYNGQDALDYGLCENYDGIILDIMMPKKNGIEVLTELRKNGVDTPVLILTAKGEVDDKILGLDSGADDYLTKPFAMGELLARIRALTRRKALISTEQFMEKIWGYETEAEINVVWVYISYLRKKLVSLNANVEIKAVRGVGYTLEEIKC